MTRTAFLLPVAILLAACDTSSSCGPGLVRGPNGECVPDAPPDGGADAGDAGDATVVDAGPCGACGGDTPLCRESDHRCVQCLSDGNCADPHPRCDTALGACVQCLDADDCDDGNHCTVDACEADGSCSHVVQPKCIAEIGIGEAHTCILRAGGELQCWGSNGFGQLGNGSQVDRTTPTFVLDIEVALDVAAGMRHTCAVLAAGDVACFGDGQVLGIPSPSRPSYARPQSVGLRDAVQVDTHAEHTCALYASGRVSCWGANHAGQLGDGTTIDSQTPVEVVGLSDAIAIAVGTEHSCALRSDGTVVCWGDGRDGQLGHGSTGGSLTPVEVVGLTDAVGLWAGDASTCALRSNGELWCWGNNYVGQLGDGTTESRSVPAPVPSVEARQAAVGAEFACALRTSGQVSCWGSDLWGQLGNGDPPSDSLTPVDVLGLTDALLLAVGFDHACAVRSTGSLVCWGRNDLGQLGDATTVDRFAPTPVVGLD